MDLIQDLNPQFSERIDYESGAIYQYGKSRDSFGSLKIQRIKRIGTGSNGTVSLVQSTGRSKNYYAVKKFSFTSSNEHKNQHRRKTFMNEAAILQFLNHSRIVKLHHSYFTPECGLLFLDYCPTGSLKVENLSDGQVMRYFMSILNALRHMHLNRIVHRDIKLDNILVKNDDAYLTDFGMSQSLPENSNLVSGRVGTPYYMAPEVYLSSRHAVYDGEKADAYSLGVVLWCMLQRSEPPNSGVFNLWSLLQASEHFDSMNSFLKDGARLLLDEDPARRSAITTLYLNQTFKVWRPWLSG